MLASGAASPALAAAAPTSPPPTAQPGPSISYKRDATPFSITVSPARLNIQPADLATPQQLTVINRGQDAVNLTVEKRNFVSGPDGSLQYEKDAPFGAADWVTVSPTHFTLAPGTAQQVIAKIVVPSKPDVGDHQVALLFLVPAGKTGGNIKLNRGIGLPAYLTVPGPVDDTVLLDGLTGPSWSFFGDVEVKASLRNIGTVHRDFRGTTPLTVTSAGATSKFSDFSIPRGSPRVVSTQWKPPLLCICRPTVSFTNTKGAVQSAGFRVIVFPWWLAAALVLLIVGVSIRALVSSRRRRIAARGEGQVPVEAVSTGDA